MRYLVNSGSRPVILTISLATAGLVSVFADAQAQTVTESEVVAVVEAFHGALASGDSAKALSHLTEDVVILESGGVEDKEHYRAGHLSGDMRFAAAIRRERGPITVRIDGNVAWAHSTSTSRGMMGEREIDSQGAELVVLTRRDGTWMIRAIHWSSRQRR
jgi:ketosteroid isomerase-like protein